LTKRIKINDESGSPCLGPIAISNNADNSEELYLIHEEIRL